MSKSKNVCASCDVISLDNLIESKSDRPPSWLIPINFVTQFIKSTPVSLIPERTNTDLNIQINLGKKDSNKLILYWGANPYFNENDVFYINNAYDAYIGDSITKSFTNYGVVRTDKNGIVNLKLNCPQPYRTKEIDKKNAESYYRHIHLCKSNILQSKWSPKVYTKVVLCKITINQLLLRLINNSIILINSLNEDYFKNNHIPGSYNLPIETVKNMNKDELNLFFNKIINEKRYSKLHNLVNKSIKSKYLEIYELPICVYCAHQRCKAAKNCATELMKMGFINILYYSGGMEEYRKIITDQ